jgi:hypothetical protein
MVESMAFGSVEECHADYVHGDSTWFVCHNTRATTWIFTGFKTPNIMRLAQDRHQWQVLKLEIPDISTALQIVKCNIMKPTGNYTYHLL